jgi:hypothetical protein
MATTPSFPFDTLIRLSNTWTQNGSPQDTVTTIRVEDPTGTVTVYTSTNGVTHPSTGYYYVDVDGDIAGTWEYRFEGAAPKGAAESYFVVEASRIDALNP